MKERNKINKIIFSLQGIYPAWRVNFKSQKEVNNYKKQLTIALKENEIKDIQVDYALRLARKDSNNKFLPTIGEFVQNCKAKIIFEQEEIKEPKEEENPLKKKENIKRLELTFKYIREDIKNPVNQAKSDAKKWIETEYNNN